MGRVDLRKVDEKKPPRKKKLATVLPAQEIIPVVPEYEDTPDEFEGFEAINSNPPGHAQQLVQDFLSEEAIEGKTRVSAAQQYAFTVLHTFHQRFPTLGFDQLRIYLVLALSKEGKSRDETVQILRGNNLMQEPPKGPPGVY